MTYEDVLEEWEKHKPQGRQNGKILWLMIAIAIEKQIPHKALNIRKGEVFRIGYCPRCKEGLSEEFKYCLECGQAIDWGEGVEE